MPTARESVRNTPLAAVELKKIILDDVVSVLDNFGMLNSQIAYGRVGYGFRLDLHIDNAMMPEPMTDDQSSPFPKSALTARPELAAVEVPPLKGTSGEDVVAGAERRRTITSPNAERVRLGLPVTIATKQQDGTIATQEVTYPPDPSAGPGDVTDTPGDVASAAARQRWGLPPLLTPPTPAADDDDSQTT